MSLLNNITTPLFVPGDRPERFEKAAASGADAVILDLEDAVAPERKALARRSLATGFTDLPVIVRVNGLGTPWHAEDMDAASKLPLAAIIVPKAEGNAAFRELASASSVPVLALVESALGLARARHVAVMPGVARLIFGSVDFCADLGCAHTRETLLSARSELVLASRLGNLAAPIDGVTTSIDDVEIITTDARHSSELGFGGKLAIHPRQITAIRSGFRPDPAEIVWANKVLASGEGATAVDGIMVDEPVRIRARSILARSIQCA
ncbi:CoA ester lyase [Rhizobium leguminosarum]|nr:CoA ester lyase [Rhizobium leguminosarum]